MFLIMTADERFWDGMEPALLLGEWCKTYGNREAWAARRHEVLPYHWDDRSKLTRDFYYIDDLYERYLSSLAGALNQIHGTSYSLRYWRIVIGPWLALFLGILFDRYESLRLAASTKRVTGTVIGDYDHLAFLHRDIRTLHKWMGDDDAFNHYLFSRIVQQVDWFPYERLRVQECEQTLEKARQTCRRRVDEILWNASLRMPSRLTRFAFVSSSLSRLDQLRLQLSLGQFPTFTSPDIVAPAARRDSTLRASLLSALSSRDEFEAVGRSIVVEQMPSAYVENFGLVHKRALAAYPRSPKLIFTSVAFGAFEGFKLWTAHHVERGVPFVGTQHGCHYGTARWSETENHERQIYDRYFTWGWTAADDARVTPLLAAKLNGATRVRPRRRGPVLLATAAWPPYFHRFTSVPVSSTGTLAHFEEQFRFARALPEEVRSQLLVRLFPNDRTWRQRARWADEFPSVRSDLGDVKFLTRLKRCRLLVCGACATPQLESFAANFPTVLFHDRRVFELRDEAVPFFDELMDAGIMHTTPEAAAELVAEVWSDPMAWWRQARVQRARRLFTERFARTSRGWLREWRATLHDLARSRAATESVAAAGVSPLTSARLDSR